MDRPAATKTIAALNDACRKALGLRRGCQGFQTAGIAALPLDTQLLIRQRVAGFAEFTSDNDPHGEHDFGAFDVPDAGKVVWKIDYYAPDMQQGSEDPADAGKTVRVLTIMLASEY